MAWNEPGGKNDDPWGKGNKNDGPPDLEVVFQNLKRRLFGQNTKNSGFNKGGNGGSGGNGSSNGFGLGGASFSVGVIGSVLAAIYVLSGIYIIQPAEEAVITRFGAYNRTELSGLHWYPRIIESKSVVNVNEVKTRSFKSPMLTKDENIVNVEIAVQYHVNNSRDYLFNVKDPEESLGQVSDSALRYVIGHSTLDEILTTGRTVIASAIREQIISNLDFYKSGLVVVDVAMQPASAPEEVKESFNDAIRAQEDEARKVNEAEAYSKRRVPIAEGSAKRLLEEAKAYKEEVVMTAKGDVSRFLALLPEYKRAPKAMRERLYLSTMEQVYSRTNKILVDVNQGNNLFYLPLDKMVRPMELTQSNVSAGSSFGQEMLQEPKQMVNNTTMNKRNNEDALRPSNTNPGRTLEDNPNDNGGD